MYRIPDNSVEEVDALSMSGRRPFYEGRRGTPGETQSDPPWKGNCVPPSSNFIGSGEASVSKEAECLPKIQPSFVSNLDLKLTPKQQQDIKEALHLLASKGLIRANDMKGTFETIQLNTQNSKEHFGTANYVASPAVRTTPLTSSDFQRQRWWEQGGLNEPPSSSRETGFYDEKKFDKSEFEHLLHTLAPLPPKRKKRKRNKRHRFVQKGYSTMPESGNFLGQSENEYLPGGSQEDAFTPPAGGNLPYDNWAAAQEAVERQKMHTWKKWQLSTGNSGKQETLPKSSKPERKTSNENGRPHSGARKSTQIQAGAGGNSPGFSGNLRPGENPAALSAAEKQKNRNKRRKQRLKEKRKTLTENESSMAEEDPIKWKEEEPLKKDGNEEDPSTAGGIASFEENSAPAGKRRKRKNKRKLKTQRMNELNSVNEIPVSADGGGAEVLEKKQKLEEKFVTDDPGHSFYFFYYAL